MSSKEFYDLFRDLEHQPLKYSGRAMYGKQCISVNTDSVHKVLVDIMELAAVSAVEKATQSATSWEDGRDELAAVEYVQSVADVLRGSRTDQMGQGAVVYWPSMEWDLETMTDCDEDREFEE